MINLDYNEIIAQEKSEMGKYANNCVTLFLKSDFVPGAHPFRSPQATFGQEYFKDAPVYVEILTLTNNQNWMAGTPKGAKKIAHNMPPDGHKGGPYPKWNRNADAMFFFYGTDPNNPEDLGAHIEYHLGEGEDEEIFEFDEPRCIFIPRGVRYAPIYVRKFHRNVIVCKIFMAKTAVGVGGVTDFEYVADDEKLKQV
jgi:hypothetical protein